jgi:hypothetical protein
VAAAEHLKLRVADARMHPFSQFHVICTASTPVRDVGLAA